MSESHTLVHISSENLLDYHSRSEYNVRIVSCVHKGSRTMTSQLTEQRIIEAEQFAASLHRLVSETKRLATNDRNRNRVRAAAKLFGIAQDHHYAIVFLFRHEFYSSSMALRRSVYEAHLRGLWIKYCATDAEIQDFIDSSVIPKNPILIKTIEALPEFGSDTLSRIDKDDWDAMCDFSHTGALHLERWESEDGIEPNFDPAELEKALNKSELCAAISGLEVAQMSEDGDNWKAVLELIEKRWPPSAP